MKKVDKQVARFLDEHFGVKNIQCCNNAMIAAAMNFLATANFLKKRETEFAAIKEAAAARMLRTMEIAHPDYSPDIQVITITMMQTTLFEEGARV